MVNTYENPYAEVKFDESGKVIPTIERDAEFGACDKCGSYLEVDVYGGTVCVCFFDEKANEYQGLPKEIRSGEPYSLYNRSEV